MQTCFFVQLSQIYKWVSLKFVGIIRMERATMKILIALCFSLVSFLTHAENQNNYITKPYEVPFERQIGFSFNMFGVSSMTFEGRFLLDLVPHLSLVVAPSYQNTIELPFYHPKRKEMSFFDIKRFHLGTGIRATFDEYDSRNKFFIEVLARPGLTWIGKDNSNWSIIPSLMAGRSMVYDSGYTVSFGVGFEWEFLLAKKEDLGYHADYLTSAYYGITKIPLMAELSVGWMWW